MEYVLAAVPQTAAQQPLFPIVQKGGDPYHLAQNGSAPIRVTAFPGSP
jgi:hypothetical protein